MSSAPVTTANENHHTDTPGAPQPLTLTSASLMLLTAALWGGTVVGTKYSEDALSPIAVAAVRFAMAAMFLIVWCILTNRRLRLTAGQAPLALVAGLLLFVQISFFNLAAFWSNASHGILLISTFVIWVVLIEHFVTKTDRLTLRKLQGMGLATTGVVLTLINVDQPRDMSTLAEMDSSTLAGDAMMLISAMVLAGKVVFTKYAVGRVEPAKFIFWHHLIGTVLFAAYCGVAEGASAIVWQEVNTPVILALLYQGVIVGGLCFVIQASLLRYHSATQIAIFGVATPLFGVVAAVILRGDAISPWFGAAGLCVAMGIYLVNSSKGVSS